MKARKKRVTSLYIFPVLFFIICLSYTIRFLFFNIETEVVKYDSVENSIKTQSLIVRSEWVCPIPVGVELDYKVNEGEKVSKGRKVLQIVKNNQADENISIKIKQLEERINEIKQADINNNFFSQDKEKIEKSIDENVRELKRIAKSGDYKDFETVKADLIANQYKKSLIYGTGSFFGKNLEQLEKEKSSLENIYKNNIDDIFAQRGGVVSYQLDGYEQILNPENIKDFKLKDIKEIIDSINLKSDEKNEETSEGIKIIDNYEWYICSIVQPEVFEGIKPGKKVKLRFNDFEGVQVNGEIYKVSEAVDDGMLIVTKINEYLDGFYKKRIANVDIIKDYNEGFLVPSDSIVEKDKIKGVYVLKSGRIKFVPVVVLSSVEGKYLVRNISQEDENYIPGYNLLKVFDEVITTTERVKENQVLTDKI